MRREREWAESTQKKTTWDALDQVTGALYSFFFTETKVNWAIPELCNIYLNNGSMF